jgi:methylated-DNA-protein-cysteine methyltransferase-like protein
MNERNDRIFAAIAAIPPGRASRARPGRLLGEVPEGMVLPWFRVLRASGHIAMPPGSRGFRQQCRLLRAEGVEVKSGRVPLSRFGLDGDLDHALWGMPGD